MCCTYIEEYGEYENMTMENGKQEWSTILINNIQNFKTLKCKKKGEILK